MKIFSVALLMFLLVPMVTFGDDHIEGDRIESGGANRIESGGGDRIEGTGKQFYESTVLENPLDSSISSIPAFFQAIIDILLVFAIPFVVFFIIYAGFLYVKAQGNAETIKKAHNALLYALIGGMLILGANVLLDVIMGTVEQIK